jgi:hypothetical protein
MHKLSPFQCICCYLLSACCYPSNAHAVTLPMHMLLPFERMLLLQLQQCPASILWSACFEFCPVASPKHVFLLVRKPTVFTLSGLLQVQSSFHFLPTSLNKSIPVQHGHLLACTVQRRCSIADLVGLWLTGCRRLLCANNHLPFVTRAHGRLAQCAPHSILPRLCAFHRIPSCQPASLHAVGCAVNREPFAPSPRGTLIAHLRSSASASILSPTTQPQFLFSSFGFDQTTMKKCMHGCVTGKTKILCVE